MATVNVRMKQRRKVAADWTSTNEVLLAGEMGLETDTRKFKFGDGVTAWNSLSYASGLSSADIGVTVQAYSANLAAFAGKTAPAGAVLGTTDAQVLSNKVYSAPTITGITTLPGGSSIDASGNIIAGAGIRGSALPTYATNAAAVTGGLAVGRFYKTATGELRIVV